MTAADVWAAARSGLRQQRSASCEADGAPSRSVVYGHPRGLVRLVRRVFGYLQYGQLPADHKLRGSMGRRGFPYDDAKAESFMKTLKHEKV